MSNNHTESSTGSDIVRIAGINTDKTRKASGSDTNYHVCFTLSSSPSQSWRRIFMEQWAMGNREKNGTWPEAGVAGAFLFIDCPLSGIAEPWLPALKRSVSLTNELYSLHVKELESSRRESEDVWKNERHSVEQVAATLQFDE